MADLYPFSSVTADRLRKGPEAGGTHKWLAQVASGMRHALTPEQSLKFLRQCCDELVSHRRVPDRDVLNSTIIPLYKAVLDEENRHKNAKEGMNKGFEMLLDAVKQKGMNYDELIFALQRKAA